MQKLPSKYTCKRKNKFITFSDYNRIMNYIQHDLGNQVVPPHVLHSLYLFTSSSRKFYSTEIPENVVTMNSEVILRMENDRRLRIRIVYPENVLGPKDISIYDSIGLACLGATENSCIEYMDDNGKNVAMIEKIVFQPEKEKLYYL
ncbi:MAG: hypothetical protein R6U78_06070 [Bacteroidales bacterium]